MTITVTPTSPWDVADIFATASFVERRRMVLDFIIAHPERHNQVYWALGTTCGTVACVAGWTCIMAGDRLVSGNDADETDYALSGDGSPALLVSERAQRLLGLSDDEASKLFFDTNSGALRQLRQLAR